ncbi:MAG: HAMP domain-containing histidine kinase [Clostridiales bacterium]|nr:HAMP domain-containing histidine kinase [Clostridiales bacterium]
MDWLDEIIEKYKIRINNLSIKRALMIYIITCVIVVIVLSVITQSVCLSWDNHIWSKYYAENRNMVRESIVYYRDMSQLNELDRVLVNVIDFIQTWSIIIYSIIGIMGTSYLFYNHKLKAPLEILREATDKVGRNDLDIDLYYDNKDEMGELCRSFDIMRKRLIENNQRMWEMMEEQKRLNAAFAHDLRTPLTVLKGYTDLLVQYIPEEKISQEKLLSTLKMMSEQILRLENYSNTMKEINSLEELPLKLRPVNAMDLEKKIRSITDILNGMEGIHIKVFNNIFDNRRLILDETMILEVFNNLMSNAIQFAKSEIEVILSLDEDGKQLLLSVADNGIGFSKADLIMATKPYYTEHKEQKSEHFGIGLYICKILCEKHQGSLLLENQMMNGAIITATFTLGKNNNSNVDKL